MNLRFATCNRTYALRFLRRFYPGCTVEDTPESAGPVLDLVEQDIFRIPDPDFHPNGVITPSHNWDDARKDEFIAALQEFHDRAMATGQEAS